MNSLNSLRMAAARPLRNVSRGGALPAPTTQSRQLLQQSSRRLYSSEPPPSRPQSFKKEFSRPIFKVALLAIFTYQLAYYGWVRLEYNERRANLNSTIAELEQEVGQADVSGIGAKLHGLMDSMDKEEQELKKSDNQKKT